MKLFPALFKDPSYPMDLENHKVWGGGSFGTGESWMGKEGNWQSRQSPGTIRAQNPITFAFALENFCERNSLQQWRTPSALFGTEDSLRLWAKEGKLAFTIPVWLIQTQRPLVMINIGTQLNPQPSQVVHEFKKWKSCHHKQSEVCSLTFIIPRGEIKFRDVLGRWCF